MTKKVLLIIIIPVVAMVFYISAIQFFRIKPSEIITTDQTKLLYLLGDSANITNDVPVSSLLIYDETVIGRGFNTVNLKNDAAGHAEINALSDAIRNVGMKNFRTMDRDKLKLITTYEPCKMCTGAILEYNIKQVIFEKPKSVKERTLGFLREFRYEINKSWSGTDTLQESLFMRNENYRKRKNLK